ncbi:MAG: hypothetical protein AB1351_02215 [Thermoproteota archaeon]
MKLGIIQALSIAALLAAAVAALPLASSPALAQMTAQTDDSFGFEDALAADANVTGMSFLVISGMSMVEGTEVAGVVVNSDNEISVTLTNENETGESDAVEVVAFSGTMDLMSILSSGQMASFLDDGGFGNSTAAMDDDRSRDSPSDHNDFFTGGNDTAFGHSMNPLGMFENVKNGSSIVPQGWGSPENVSVTLVDNATDAAPTADPDTTFVFVMIVPYTAEQATLEG